MEILWWQVLGPAPEKRGTAGSERGVKWALMILALTGLFPGAARATELPIYYVRALGDVDQAHTAYICRVVTEVFQVRCQVLRPRPLLRSSFDGSRGQYDADFLVKKLFDELPRDGLGLLGVTNADLFESGRSSWFVFGLASLLDHVGVVSLARYRGTWWGEAPDKIQFQERLYKVVVHEVAHTLGRDHCPNRRCAMRDDRTLADLDDSPRHFCRKCRSAIAVARRQGHGTGRWHYERGHSHLNRAQFAQAVYHFEQAVELMPNNARVLNDLGVAYLRRGDSGRALWSFRHARRLDPSFANPAYNEGLVFAGVGDANMARIAFEEAVTADSSWGLAHRQLGFLYQEAFGDEDRALEHYQNYLAAHGNDLAIEARIRMIKGGGQTPTP